MTASNAQYISSTHNLVLLREQMKGVLLRLQDNLKCYWLVCAMVIASCNSDNELLNAASSYSGNRSW